MTFLGKVWDLNEIPLQEDSDTGYVIGCNSNAPVVNCDFLAAITSGIISFLENLLTNIQRKSKWNASEGTRFSHRFA